MAEHIKQRIEMGKKSICDFCFHQKVCKGTGNQPCTKCSHYQDAANVAPVRHGKWIRVGYACGETEWQCSSCKETEWRTSSDRLKYCPFCGSMMDLEV